MHLVTASAMDDSATSVCSGVKHVASQISYNHRTASRGRKELCCERARSPERKRGGCYLAVVGRRGCSSLPNRFISPLHFYTRARRSLDE